MGGTVLFQDALRDRLSIITPSKQDVAKFQEQHPLVLTPGIKELIDLLHSQGKVVYLVSGGFRQVICVSIREMSNLVIDMFFDR